MIVEYHVILIKNLAESFDENSNESLIIFYFNLVIRNCCDDADQNSCNVIESYFSFF